MKGHGHGDTAAQRGTSSF